MKNLYSGNQCGGFQFLLILHLWGISFHAVVVCGLGKTALFKSVLGHCVICCKNKSYLLLFLDHSRFLGDTILSSSLSSWWWQSYLQSDTLWKPLNSWKCQWHPEKEAPSSRSWITLLPRLSKKCKDYPGKFNTF